MPFILLGKVPAANNRVEQSMPVGGPNEALCLQVVEQPLKIALLPRANKSVCNI